MPEVDGITIEVPSPNKVVIVGCDNGNNVALGHADLNAGGDGNGHSTDSTHFNSAKHETVDVPASNMKKSIAQILLDEGYIKDLSPS